METFAPTCPALRRRLPGWESRLAALIESARSRPYQLGEHDCVAFACGAVQALTGVDIWSAWRGRYSTKLGALRVLLEYGGGFTGSFTRGFEIEPCPVAQARRGDILELRQEDPHLCVLVGAKAAGLADQGLYFVDRELCVHAWRIG